MRLLLPGNDKRNAAYREADNDQTGQRAAMGWLRNSSAQVAGKDLVEALAYQINYKVGIM